MDRPLPRYADPTERYSKAVEALRAMHLGMGARSKWDEFLPHKEMPVSLKFFEKSSRLGILGVLEMMPEAVEETPDWLAQLLESKEAAFVTVLSDAYARLSAERPAVHLQSTSTQEKLREMRTSLLDELQALLGEMRKISPTVNATRSTGAVPKGASKVRKRGTRAALGKAAK
jgi:hypothetical protein